MSFKHSSVSIYRAIYAPIIYHDTREIFKQVDGSRITRVAIERSLEGVKEKSEEEEVPNGTLGSSCNVRNRKRGDDQRGGCRVDGVEGRKLA